VPGADVVGNLCPDVATELGVVGRTPTEGVEVLGAVLALGVENSEGTVCAEVPTTLGVLNLTAL